jgi:hypothetical protein
MNQTTFNEKGFCIVRAAIDSDLRDFITQYALFDEMQNLVTGDTQVPNAHSKYADPCMESLLLRLQSVIEEHTKLSVYPTYSYYRVYRPGDSLEKHKDRPSCEISATLCFNYSYNEKDLVWPIFMDGIEVILQPGDLVIYKGCELDHWREVFNSPNINDWHVQGFFHYVDSNGLNADFKFDKRKSIGEVSKNKKPQNQHTNKSYITYTK